MNVASRDIVHLRSYSINSRIGAICLVLAMFWGLASFSQTQMEVQVDQNRISMSGNVHLQYSVSDAEKLTGFVPPSFAGFEVVQGPDHTSGWTMDKGSMRSYVSVSFVLKPLKKGKFVLEAATGIADGKKIRSPQVTIDVDDQGALGSVGSAVLPSDQPLDEMVLKPGESVAEKVRKNIFVKLEVSRNSVYVGEPLVATYKLYTRLNSESRVIHRPSFTGFSVYEMGDNGPVKSDEESVNGKVYDMYVLRRVQLYPLQEGRYELQSIEVENTVKFIRGENTSPGRSLDDILRSMDAVGDPSDAWHKEQINLSSTPQTIIVKPLPAAGRSSGFNGAVGDFTMKLGLQGPVPAVGEVANLELVMEGTGNLPIMGNPDISWPKGIEHFEPDTKEELDQTQSPIRGKRAIIIPFSVSDTGRYVIPSVSMTVFDPLKASYVQVTTAPLPIDVLQLSRPRKNTAHEDMKAADPGFQLAVRYIWPVITVMLAGIFTLMLYRRRKKAVIKQGMESPTPQAAPVVHEMRSERKKVPERMIHAETLLGKGKPREACAEIEKALLAYLSSAYDIGGGLSLDRMYGLLIGKNLDERAAGEIIRILRECQEMSFAPFDDEKAAARLLDDVRDIFTTDDRV
jgi:hypothetical protein